MSVARLDATLRARVVDALAPHNLTRDLDAALATAIRSYRDDADHVPHATWMRRRKAMRSAAKAVTALVEALDGIDRAFAQSAPTPSTRRSRFIHDMHGRLRAEAVSCATAWTAWRAAPHVPQPRPRHRPSDAAQHQLGMAVVFALLNAGIPLIVHRRQRSAAEEAVREVCAAAGAPLGRDAYRRLRGWFVEAKAIDKQIRTS